MFKFFSDLFFVYECFIDMYVQVPGAGGSQKRALHPLKLQLKMVLSHQMRARN